MQEIIKESFVLLNCFDFDKDTTINTIATVMDEDGRLNDKNGYIEDILHRESVSSTAIGFGFAAPHTKSKNIKSAALGFAHYSKPVKWDEKGSLIEVFFQIAMPENPTNEEIILVGNLFKSFVDQDFREKVLSAENPKQIVSIINNLQSTI